MTLLRDPFAPAPEPSRQDFAQRISVWLSAFDAVKLQAAHQAISAVPVNTPAPLAAAGAGARSDALAQCARTVQAQLQRVRSALTQSLVPPSLRPDSSGASGRAGARPRGLSAAVPLMDADALQFGPLRHRYLEHQRQMDARIGPLREFVRQAISTASPTLRQLALLDAAMEQMLGPREQKVLASIPALLERRFEHLRTSAPPEPPPAPDTPGAAPAWLDAFQHEMHGILLAELGVRLLPVEGLADALHQATKK